MREQLRRLFDNDIIVAISTGVAWLVTFCVPTDAVKAAAGAVLITMGLDLLTKIFALSRQHKGFFKAVRSHVINSSSFAKGTLDKLILFGILLVIAGCARQLTLVAELATWFTQIFFTIMFLRDALSIIENLSDAGIAGLEPIKRLLKKKLKSVISNEEKKK